jgi:hypothetical protein
MTKDDLRDNLDVVEVVLMIPTKGVSELHIVPHELERVE